MFAGSSGTGKTLSASIIAHELGLDLYQVDLWEISIVTFRCWRERVSPRTIPGCCRLSVPLITRSSTRSSSSNRKVRSLGYSLGQGFDTYLAFLSGYVRTEGYSEPIHPPTRR